MKGRKCLYFWCIRCEVMYLHASHAMRWKIEIIIMILSSRSESFSKTVMFLWLLNFSKVTTKHTENMTKITQNRWYAKSPSVPFVARQRTLTSIASKICMSHIIIWNLFLLHTSEDFLSTYYSNLTFLKAAKSGGKDSHAFNTEVFFWNF